MKEILAESKTVHELLSNARYGIDYYQREYRWGAKQVQELLDDLAGEFLDDFDKTHERTAVEKYGHYFLDSIIISHKNAQKFVVDGQQRLTTLTLLLIYLHNLMRDGEHSEDAATVSGLIFSKKCGSLSFNLAVEERTACMEALFKGDPFDAEGQPESVRNIVARYGDLPYEQKLPHYYGQNLLARSLHPDCYDHNPGFLKYADHAGLPFGPHEQFKRAHLDERQDLYRRIAEEVWDPARLEREAAS